MQKTYTDLKSNAVADAEKIIKQELEIAKYLTLQDVCQDLSIKYENLIVDRMAAAEKNAVLEEEIAKYFALQIAHEDLSKKHDFLKNNYSQTIENLSRYEKRFSKIIDIDKELNLLTNIRSEREVDIEECKVEINECGKQLQDLLNQISIYSDEIKIMEMGHYKPHFNFDASEKYKDEINKIRSEQKNMLKEDKAIFCKTSWSVGGSEAEGRKMTDRIVKLTARAFNFECEVCVSEVEWSNINKMEARIKKAFDDINKLNLSNHIVISEGYLSLRVKELYLAYEHKKKKQEEKEEQAEIKRQMREEEKAEREAQAAEKAAEKEEEMYEKMLLKAQAEAAEVLATTNLANQENDLANQEKISKINAQMEELQQKLNEAHAKMERAKSMAQQTKSGYVYIISNIGSFGENVYKIGMTRRLEPLDRVDELGDASVPFCFDVHALVYSDNAPEMENALHKKFANQRLNLVNTRKEFFRVPLDDIQKEVLKVSPKAIFTMTAVANEYQESEVIRAAFKVAEQQKDVIAV